jgi:hypothetical protein
MAIDAQFGKHGPHGRPQLEAVAGKAERMKQIGRMGTSPHDREAVGHPAFYASPAAHNESVGKAWHHGDRGHGRRLAGLRQRSGSQTGSIGHSQATSKNDAPMCGLADVDAAAANTEIGADQGWKRFGHGHM